MTMMGNRAVVVGDRRVVVADRRVMVADRRVMMRRRMVVRDRRVMVMNPGQGRRRAQGQNDGGKQAQERRARGFDHLDARQFHIAR